MNVVSWMILESRVMNKEAEIGQVTSHEHCGRLLALHADSKCLDASEQQERVERCQSVSNCVDDESDFL